MLSIRNLLYKHKKLKNSFFHSIAFPISNNNNMNNMNNNNNKPAKSNVYTRTGDKGTTSLFTGHRTSKTSDYFTALGNIDELNASIGVAKEYCLLNQIDINEQLEEIQSRLFDIGSHLATPKTYANDKQIKLCQFPNENVIILEQWIDQLDSECQPLKNFILPGGGMEAAYLHLCRTIARRAERSVVPLIEKEDADIEVLKYVNRLSDYFFVAARFASQKKGIPDVIWKKPRK